MSKTPRLTCIWLDLRQTKALRVWKSSTGVIRPNLMNVYRTVVNSINIRNVEDGRQFAQNSIYKSYRLRLEPAECRTTTTSRNLVLVVPTAVVLTGCLTQSHPAAGPSGNSDFDDFSLLFA
jgi:hypothetical protein